LTNNVQGAARPTGSRWQRDLFKICLTTATFHALYMGTFYPKLLLAAVAHSSESELKRFAWLVVSATRRRIERYWLQLLH